jgi:hypothetical protein
MSFVFICPDVCMLKLQAELDFLMLIQANTVILFLPNDT